LKFIAVEYDPPCHISNPWFCERRLYDNGKTYHPAYIAYKNLTTPEIYVANDYCVQGDINRDYWVSFNIVHPYNPNNTSGGSTTISSSVSIFLALLLIELALLI